jgi:hypothetical protein
MNVEPSAIEFSARASLVALGLRFQVLAMWPAVQEHVQIKQKVRQYAPLEKLLDCFINILAGGIGVVEVNTRVRPDRALQLAFGRTGCAEQSTISDTLNACTPENVTQLRQALQVILQRHSQSCHHDYTQTWQVLDVDLTGMPAGRLGEGVTPGYFAKQKNHRGRQLGRVVATLYDEILVDRLYDGKRVLHRSLQELLTSAEEVLELAENKRASTIVRLDAGGGEEADINWVLGRGYALLVKVKNWRRAHKLAASVTEWHPDPKVPEREVGWVTQLHVYDRPTRQLAVRHRKKNGEWSYHVLVFNLTDAMLLALADQAMSAPLQPRALLLIALHAYDRRGGGVETQNKGDKQGLGLSHRNKHCFASQEMLVLLGQLAHDLVIWTRNDLAKADPRLHKYGVQRTVRDALQIAGQVEITADGHVHRIVLNQKHPLAEAVHAAFAR